MPNWADSKVEITGDKETLDKVVAQLSKPYKNVYGDVMEGEFLLWNIVAPTDIDAYLEKEKKAFDEIAHNNPDLASPPLTPEEMQENLNKLSADFQSGAFAAEVINDIATKNDWYNWNVRNWGTKWEISEDQSYLEKPVTQTPLGDYSVVYRISTAWSPPMEALDKLAEQYPTITIALDSIDEGDCFAIGAYWSDGERTYEENLEITHDLQVELKGICWACVDDDEESAGRRAELGCPTEEAK